MPLELLALYVVVFLLSQYSIYKSQIVKKIIQKNMIIVFTLGISMVVLSILLGSILQMAIHLVPVISIYVSCIIYKKVLLLTEAREKRYALLRED